jgi:hypothetical protein
MSISDEVRALEERYLEKQRRVAELEDRSFTLTNSLRDHVSSQIEIAWIKIRSNNEVSQHEGWGYWHAAVRLCDLMGFDYSYLKRNPTHKKN